MNTETYDDLFSAALSLSPNSKVMLAEHLLKSLDDDNQERIEKIWSEEAEKRVQQIEEGEIKKISKDKVFQELNLKRK